MEKPNLVSIEAQPRQIGPDSAMALRTANAIPAVLYGPNTENIHFSVAELELERLLKAEDAQFIDIAVDGKHYTTIVRSVDFHPVTDRPIHADFYALDSTRPVTMTIPLRLSGSAPGVLAGGRLDHNLKKVKVRCLADQVPAHVKADISKLNIGETLSIKDLNFEGMTVMASPERTVVIVKPPRGGKKAEAKK